MAHASPSRPPAVQAALDRLLAQFAHGALVPVYDEPSAPGVAIARPDAPARLLFLTVGASSGATFGVSLLPGPAGPAPDGPTVPSGRSALPPQASSAPDTEAAVPLVAVEGWYAEMDWDQLVACTAHHFALPRVP